MSNKKYQLPKDFAEKWIAALRSGEYGQGKGTLGNAVDGYCCLGVAGRVIGCTDDMLKGAVFEENLGIPSKIYSTIPDILKGAGRDHDFVDNVVTQNDHDNKSFPEIADWIEQNVEFV